MATSRREFLRETALGAAFLSVLGSRGGLSAALRAPAEPKLRIGGCDWSLGMEGRPGAYAAARECGLEGVEVSCGVGAEKLPISDPAGC